MTWWILYRLRKCIDRLAPWLIKECVLGGDGGWWATHAIELTPKGESAATGLAAIRDLRSA